MATQSAGGRDLYISLLGSQCLACGRDGDGGGGKGRDAKNMQIHFAKREYSFAFACRCVCVCVRQSHCICRLWITAGTHFLSHHYFVRFVVGGGGDGGTLLATHRNRHTIYVRHVQQIALLYIMRYVLHACDRRTPVLENRSRLSEYTIYNRFGRVDQISIWNLCEHQNKQSIYISGAR